MNVIIFRHAEAGFPHGVKDFDRPLTNRGREMCYNRAKQLADFLGKETYVDCLVSPALRTKQTFELISSDLFVEKLISEQELYASKWEIWMKFLNNLPETKNSILLVGHNPEISDLIFELTGESIALNPGNAVVISFKLASTAMISRQTGVIVERWIEQS